MKLFSHRLLCLVPWLLLAAGSAVAAERLTVQIVGDGTVACDPAGTPCGDACREYPTWTLVTLTPTAGSGWSFGDWQGPGNGSPPRYVFMDGDKQLTAVFRQDPGTPTTITVDAEQVINPDIVGLGVNFHIMFVPQDGSDRQAFYQLLKQSGATWIRVVPQYYEWENLNNDDGNPWTEPATFLSDNFDGFAWNRGGQLHYGLKSLLDTSEAADIWLEINNWEVSLKDWLQPDYYSNPNSYPIPSDRFKADAAEFGENLAALIYYLKTRANGGQGYQCVKYWAVWNEPGGGHPGQEFINFDFPGTMNLLYQKVAAHLQLYDQLQGTDVCQQVQAIGFEGFPFFRDCPHAGHAMETWEEMVGRGVIQYLEEPDGIPGEITNWPDGDPNMDIIAFHDYWSVFDYDAANPDQNNQGTLRDRFLGRLLSMTLEQIRQYDIDGQIEPVFIGELGSKPYKHNPTSFEQSLFIMEGALRALQLDGVKAINKWSFNTHYEWTMVSYPGFDWEMPPMGSVHTVAESYVPFKLVASSLPRHADVVQTTVLGGIDASSGGQGWTISETQRLWATAVRTPAGELVLLVVNDSYQPKQVRLVLGPGISENLAKSFVTSSAYQQISTDELAQLPGGTGEFSDEIPARSIVAYRGAYGSAAAQCLDEVTLQQPDGTLFDCTPYRCRQAACTDSCSSGDDCAPGFFCTGGSCIQSADGEPSQAGDDGSPADDGGDDGGTFDGDTDEDGHAGGDDGGDSATADVGSDGGDESTDTKTADVGSACSCRTSDFAHGLPPLLLLLGAILLLAGHNRKVGFWDGH